MSAVRLIAAGARLRGTEYASYAAQHPDQAQVVGVANPNDFCRERMARTHGIPAEDCFLDWRAMARFIEAVATGDPGRILSGPATSLATHRIVFAAEWARRPGRVVTLRPDRETVAANWR